MATSLVIKNGKVLTPAGDLVSADLLIQNGRIAQIAPNLQADTQIDAADAFVIPGLIEMHTHGIGFESPESETLDEYARIMASCGATAFYLTLFAPPDKTAANMTRHRRSTDELRRIPQLAGFRLESPYLAFAGGGVSTDIVPISDQTTDLLLETGGGHIKIWDVSPELPGAVEVIRKLTNQGIVCTLAHSRCSIDQAKAAVDAGLSLVTHLFDTFELPSVKDPGVYPAGLTDYLLVEDRVCCEIIGDGTHVHPLLVEKTFRCKSPDRICFITDSNFGAGLAPGTYTLPGWNAEVLISDANSGVRLIHRDMGLVGSALTPIDNFRNVVNLFKKDLATASRVCSRTPARLLGLNKGELAPGKDADIILLDSELNIRQTIVAGAVVYQKT